MTDNTTPEAIASVDPDAGKSREQIADEVWEERDRKAADPDSSTKAEKVPAADEETGTAKAKKDGSDAPSDPDAKDESDGTADAEDGTVEGHDAAYWAAQTKIHQAGFTRVSQEMAALKKDVKAKDRELGELRAQLGAHQSTAKELGVDAETSEAATKAVAEAREKQAAEDAEAEKEATRQAEARKAAGEFASTYLTQRHGQEWLQIPNDPLYRAWAAKNVPAPLLQKATEYDAFALDLIIRDFKSYKAGLTKKQEASARAEAGGASPETDKARKTPMGGARPSKAATPETGDEETAEDVWNRSREEHKRATEKAIREFTPSMRRRSHARA